jgi:superfamily II DNA/RNA helicase
VPLKSPGNFLTSEYKDFFMSFDQFNLDSRLNAAIKWAGFYKPTPIQTASIPHALAGHDLIGTAQMGPGSGDSSEFGPVNLGQISVRAEVNASYSLQ